MQQEANQVQQEGRFASELFNWGECVMGVLIFIVLVFTFLIRFVVVDGSSMYPTLEDRNIMLVSGFHYTPEKGDVVVLRKDGFYGSQPIVKRVIATGGDTIAIDAETGDVSINGVVQEESYIAEKIDPDGHMGDWEYPLTVPEGSIFVMGDNRNASTDSRWSSLGMVDTRYVIGHVLQVVYPLNQFGTVA